ncbi:MAG: type II secretion system ATPase GspE [Candidatus Omnitrophota bacterium]
MAKIKKNLDLLVNKGIITRQQLDKAKEESVKSGLTLEKTLENMRVISEVEIAKALAEAMGIPFIDLDNYLIDPEVIKLIPEAIAKKFKVAPLFQVGDSLTVAMVNPQDVLAIDEVRMVSKIGAIDQVLATPDMIQRVIDRYYAAMGNVEEIVGGLEKDKTEDKFRAEKNLEVIADDPPVIKLVSLLIIQAVKDRASDIHIEPSEQRLLVRYRIDGILQEVNSLPKKLQGAVISRIKVLAKLDIAESRKPQDGRICLRLENRDLDIRVSTFPTMHGENVVMRLLDKSSVLLGLRQLGFSEEQYSVFEKFIRRPNGIIMVTGPTGSGKTTTLYAALSSINSTEKNIITLEDPVEYELPLIRQTAVNPKAGITFANGLRSILRQDPDIIMVGEVRDKETADMAIQASLTGHLVFSTLHTNDAPSALTRLIDMGVEPFLISSSVIGILAQRLVRVICDNCKERYKPVAGVLKDLGLVGDKEFYRGRGCNRCRDTGFMGRIGIFELLIINEEIRKMVDAKKSADEIEKKGIELGMKTLRQDGLDKAARGITTLDEVLKVTNEAG